MYQTCPWSYKLVYVDKVGIRKKNLHLSFGSAIHESAEKKVLNESINEVEVFSKRYDSEIDGYLDIIRQRIATKQNGCQWQRHYISQHNHDFAEMTRTYLKNQNSGNPDSDWTFA